MALEEVLIFAAALNSLVTLESVSALLGQEGLLLQMVFPRGIRNTQNI